MWKKESKWINTRMEKVINHNLYFKDARLLTAKEMREYEEKIKNREADIAYTRKMLECDISNTEEFNLILEEVMEAITSAPSLIL
jgi:hypothetical protein